MDDKKRIKHPTDDQSPPTHSRRDLVRGAAAGAAALGGLAVSRAGAQEGTPAASPAASPSASPVAVGDVIPSPIAGVPDAYLRRPTPFQSYEGCPAPGAR